MFKKGTCSPDFIYCRIDCDTDTVKVYAGCLDSYLYHDAVGIAVKKSKPGIHVPTLAESKMQIREDGKPRQYPIERVEFDPTLRYF